MGDFKLDESYVEVNERILEFREKHPNGTLQCEIINVPEAFAGKFLAVRATAYRTPDDERPGVGLAWEPVPGKTPYTKDSELMVAETSAWGRALIAVGAADAKRGIASANEVRNRRASKTAEKPAAKSEPKAESTFICTVKSEEGWPCVRPTYHTKESKAHFFRKPDGYSGDSVPAGHDLPSSKPPEPEPGSSASGPGSTLSETLPLDV